MKRHAASTRSYAEVSERHEERESGMPQAHKVHLEREREIEIQRERERERERESGMPQAHRAHATSKNTRQEAYFQNNKLQCC